MPNCQCIAVIGAGGKTTLLRLLGHAHAREHVLLTTTTHIYPFGPDGCDRLCVDPDPAALHAALAVPGVVCAGCTAAEGKLTGLPEPVWETARAASDWIFYEADGSKHLPLKLHRPVEPVIRPDTDLCLLVAGLSALGQPVGAVVHRYGLHPVWQAAPDRPTGTDEILYCIREGLAASGMPRTRCRVLLSQADTPARYAAGAAIRDVLTAEGISADFFDRDNFHPPV